MEEDDDGYVFYGEDGEDDDKWMIFGFAGTSQPVILRRTSKN